VVVGSGGSAKLIALAPHDAQRALDAAVAIWRIKCEEGVLSAGLLSAKWLV